MKLQTKIIAALVPMFLVVFVAHSLFTLQTAFSNARSNVEREAHNIRAVLMATRRVYHHQFIESGLPVDDTTVGFLPGHSLSRISKDFPQWTNSGIVFNNVSDRARNSDNAADEKELAAMEVYRKNSEIKDRLVLVDDEGKGEYYHYTRPIWIEDYCLKCHGKRDEVLASVAARYNAGFGYELGDLRGVMSIKIPAKVAHQQAWAAFWQGMLVDLGCHLGAFVLVYAMLVRTAVSRLKVLERGAEELAGGNYKWRSGITGSDEIAAVAMGIDAMAGRIGTRDAALRDSEWRFRNLIEAAPDAMVIVDQQGIMIVVNAVAESTFGYTREEMLGQELEFLIPARFHEAHRTHRQEYCRHPMARPMSVRPFLFGLRKDGSEFPLEISLSATETDDGIVVTSTIRDVSDRKQLEDESREHRDTLAHVARMSTMGEMATGIAHELNQPLTAIATYCHTTKWSAERFTACPPELIDSLEKIEKQAIRAGDIVRRLRQFVRKSKSEEVPVDLNSLIGDVARMVEPDVRQSDVVLELNCHGVPLAVSVDEIQIQQVLVNLIRNSIDAMKDTPDEQKRVVVSARSSETGFAEIAVIDLGPGLSPQDMEQVFEAFYSTKPDGMGMGLAISRSIVEFYGGKFFVESNAGQGVTFRFTLPLIRGEFSAENAA
jgi:PAS domain S-box-containing protein